MATTQSPPLPLLPCPSCNENILEKGFHNNCTETQVLREDNYTAVWQGRLVIDHDEDDYQMIDHECDVKAYCTNCETLLPWPLYVIRGLDGKPIQDAAEAIEAMLLNAQTQNRRRNLVELGVTLAGADAQPATPASCKRCRSAHDPQNSTSRYPSIFCSKACEGEFIRRELAALTLDDCIRLQAKLENLPRHIQETRSLKKSSRKNNRWPTRHRFFIRLLPSTSTPYAFLITRINQRSTMAPTTETTNRPSKL